MNKKVKLIDKGLIDYKKCWDFQANIFNEIIRDKIAIRKGKKTNKTTQNFLIFCEFFLKSSKRLFIVFYCIDFLPATFNYNTMNFNTYINKFLNKIC